MDHQRAITQLKAERPDLVPALQALVASAKADAAAREAVNTVTSHLLSLQLQVDDKRSAAKKCLREQPCATTSTGAGSYHCLRHVPDVLIRELCRIAETPMLTSADSEWLDMMEAKHTK